MRSATSLRIFLITALCFGVSQPVKAQDAGQLQWFSVAAADGKSAAWGRWAVDGGSSVPEAARLALVGNARCSLYVNGQRLLKYDQFAVADSTTIARVFDVQPLLRPGRNMVAVEVQGAESGAIFGARLVLVRGGAAQVVGGPWKQAPAPPPVGWEQTDFNDRDWKEFKSPEQAPAFAAMVQIPAKAESAARKGVLRRTLPFEFQDGDHVVFVGATFVERAQLSEHLESILAGTLGNRRVTFRNLGWSADTVQAESRGIFDAPAVGYLRMVEHIRAEEPTVAILCYGQNEALTAGMTPDQFSRQFGQFVDELQASGIPCVIVSPHELFPAKAPIPSPARFNSKIRLYADAAGSTAQSRQLPFVDLFSDFTTSMQSLNSVLHPQATGLDGLAENGMHLTADGYACAALVLRQRLLGLAATPAKLRIDVAAGKIEATGTEIEDVRFLDGGKQVSLKIRPQTLSPLPVAAEIVRAASDKPTTVSIFADSGYAALRQLIQKKNELYFHRWRPQNVTYLFGFRKHEQGNNAADIARFDPFIRDLEQQIQKAQQPQWTEVTIPLTAAPAK
jgi:lysophospholipase L1-like esterase